MDRVLREERAYILNIVKQVTNLTKYNAYSRYWIIV